MSYQSKINSPGLDSVLALFCRVAGVSAPSSDDSRSALKYNSEREGEEGGTALPPGLDSVLNFNRCAARLSSPPSESVFLYLSIKGPVSRSAK